MRVATSSLLKTMLLNIEKNLNKVGNYQKKLSTGKQLTRPSDNPIDTAKALSLRQAIKDNEQYRRNIDDTLAWLDTTDVALSQYSSALLQVRDMTILAANDTASADNRANMATEIENLKQTIIDSINTSHAGRFIFSGSMTKTSPLDGAMDYVGDYIDLAREVSRKNSLSVNVIGANVLKIDQSAGYDVVANSILTTIDSVITVLNQEKDGFGRPTAGEINQYLDPITNTLENLTTVIADVGVKINRLQDIYLRHEEASLNLTGLLSKKEDADMTRLITELRIAENVHEASLAAAARIIQPSLLDFLR